MKILDNFLDVTEFNIIQNIMLGGSFTWNYSSAIVYKEDKDKFQFCHHFYHLGMQLSSYVDILNPITEKLKAFQIHRIKANLLTRTHDIVENDFHIDPWDLQDKEKLKQWTTSIFYINSNNGYTEFEDGTKVESIANRMVTFPADCKHRGTSCSDEKIRVVINFNYFQL